MSCTSFQAGLGAVLQLPVAGGFTVGQVIVLKSFVWGWKMSQAMLVAGHVLMGA